MFKKKEKNIIILLFFFKKILSKGDFVGGSEIVKFEKNISKLCNRKYINNKNIFKISKV